MTCIIIDAPVSNPIVLVLMWGIPFVVIGFILYHLCRALWTGDWSAWKDPK